MSVLLLDDGDVRRLLPMAACMDVMAQALGALARGEAILPLRPILPLPDRRGALAMMPAWLESPPALGLKVISYFPANLGTAQDTHQGAVLLFDTSNGRLLAILDATSITAIRTAAVSGVATRLLARPEARTLALLGSGVQAQTHLAAMLEARPGLRVRVWSRDRDRVAAFIRGAAARFGCDVEAAASARDAVHEADVVCTVTSAREPVLEGVWLAPGTHVNAVGSSIRSARELDTAAVVRSRMFVDRRESAAAEAGDFIIPKQEGAIGDDHIVGELGELLLDRIPGRRNATEITLFKSLGLAVEDLAAAHHIYQQALATGAGTRLDLGGTRLEW